MKSGHYSIGTITVAAGGTTVTGVGTSWAGKVFEGDLLHDPVQGLIARVTADVVDNGLMQVNPWPGAALDGAPYEILFMPDSVRASERARRLLELVAQAANTGIGIDAWGDLAGRAAHDAAAAGFAYLSTDGDGALISDPVVFIKASSASADWGDVIEFRGARGPQGPSGLVGIWRGAWVTATAYALKDIVREGGSSYICKTAHTSGATFAGDVANWDLAVAKGDTGATGAAGTNGTNGTNGVDGTGLFSRVRVVDTIGAAVATAYASGSTIDGVVLATNDLVLRATSGGNVEDGIYVVPPAGAASRAPSFDTYDEIPGVYISVMEGVANADSLWRCTSNKGGVLGTTALVFAQFSGGVSLGAVVEDVLPDAASIRDLGSAAKAWAEVHADMLVVPGIKFPAIQVASADPNTLDDYEEGTWTPIISFSTPGDLAVTYGLRIGDYVKIGRLVFAPFVLTTSAFTHTTASGNFQITGLPFAISGSAGEARGSIGFGGWTKANYTMTSIQTPANQTYLSVVAFGSGQNATGLNAPDVPSGGANKNIGGQTLYLV